MKLKRKLIFALSCMFMLGTLCMSFNSKAEEQEENTYDIVQGSGGGTTTEAPTTATPTTEATTEEQVLEYIEINDVNFPDHVFRRYLSDTFDEDKDNIIKISDVQKISISGSNPGYTSQYDGVKSFKGIEYFKDLTLLACANQKGVTNIDVSKNISLEFLYCESCSIEELDLTKNINLLEVDCTSNKITNFNIKGLSNLTNIHCSGNLISELDLTGCNLYVIHCVGNLLTEIDLSNMTELYSLYISDNKLENIKFGNNPNLLIAQCQKNNLKNLSLANTSVVELGVDYDTIESIDVTNCTSLNSLFLYVDTTTGTIELTKFKGLDTSKFFKDVAGKTITCEKDVYYKTENSGYIDIYYNNFLDITWVANSDQTWSCYDANGNMLKDVWTIGNDFEKRYIHANGKMAQNSFVSDGTYTYYLQYDGTPMKDRLTYHPDNSEVIYFDKDGHEVFNDFAHISTSISGEPVDDYCYFGALGYMYVDVVTYDKAGVNLYYANPYGVLERGKWFQFSDTVMCADGTPWNGAAGKYGYANADGTLMVNTYTYDWLGRLCYMQGNGAALY